MFMRKGFKTLLAGLTVVALLSGCPIPSGSNGSNTSGSEIQEPSEAFAAALVDLENQLLALINQERVEAGLPELVRDEGLDLIMLWYGSEMVLDHHIGHIDSFGRESEGRVRHYSGRDDVRCSEITAWWSGASAEAHYEAYFNSPGHHAAYMEEGIFNLGPTTHVGVVMLEGTGPEGSEFEDRMGTYSGLVFCDDAVEIDIDPFEEEV